jgi:hypothetical protein
VSLFQARTVAQALNAKNMAKKSRRSSVVIAFAKTELETADSELRKARAASAKLMESLKGQKGKGVRRLIAKLREMRLAARRAADRLRKTLKTVRQARKTLNQGLKKLSQLQQTSFKGVNKVSKSEIRAAEAAVKQAVVQVRTVKAATQAAKARAARRIARLAAQKVRDMWCAILF